MQNSGSFYTTTKTKIHTEVGTVLMVIHYEYAEIPRREYRVRTICGFCGSYNCFCFSDGDYENPFESAKQLKNQSYVCEEPNCVIKCAESNVDKKVIDDLKKNHPDPYELRDAIWEYWGEWDDAPYECGV